MSRKVLKCKHIKKHGLHFDEGAAIESLITADNMMGEDLDSKRFFIREILRNLRFQKQEENRAKRKSKRIATMIMIWSYKKLIIKVPKIILTY